MKRKPTGLTRRSSSSRPRSSPAPTGHRRREDTGGAASIGEEVLVRIRSRVLNVVTTSILFAAAGVSFAPAAGAGSPTGPRGLHAGQTAVRGVPRSTERLLYSQYDLDEGTAISSQNFDNVFDAYDDAGADDFTVPAGHVWRIKEVDVAGTYRGTGGPTPSERVSFYADDNGLPGALIKAMTLTGTDNSGSFAIPFGALGPVRLKGGDSGRTYWVSIRANMDYFDGQWFWETRTAQSGNGAAWENPGGGWGTTCSSWGRLTKCLPHDGEGPDFMFALKGKQG
jgi:hypothetical protein